MQIRKHPLVLGLLTALFLWQVAHQVMPSIWSFYTMYKFGWTEAVVGGSLAFVGMIMVLGQSTLPRVVIPRLGEQRTALTALAVGATGYAGYAFAGVYSLSSIIGPPLMTQMFRRFTAAGATVHFPGAPFVLSSALALGAMVVFWNAARTEAREEGAL